MKQAKIYMLDLFPFSNFSEQLQKIFESSESINFQVLIEPFIQGHKKNLQEGIRHFDPDVIALILSSCQLNQGKALFQSLRNATIALPIIVVIDKSKPDDMMALLKAGVTDFISPPFKTFDVLPRFLRLLKQRYNSDGLLLRLKEKLGLSQIIGESPAIFETIKKIPILSKCDATVLISGETGTGKELCARAIHYLSTRAINPFMPVNCGAIPEELVENELFGHVQGAFTGASSSQPGLIHAAEGGTLFLDEVDCLPLKVQVKLLRFLQDKEYRQLGSTKMQQVDVRVIAATNVHLEKVMQAGQFRRDLFYRLNIIPLSLPPLRKRQEDIPLLTYHFFQKYTDELDKRMSGFSPNAIQKLLNYDWPGNVRELQNVIERAVVLSEQNIIGSADIDLPLQKIPNPTESFKEAKDKIVAQFERTYVQKLLTAYQGNISKAAQSAKKNRRAFWELIRKHKIDVTNFKGGQGHYSSMDLK